VPSTAHYSSDNTILANVISTYGSRMRDVGYSDRLLVEIEILTSTQDESLCKCHDFLTTELNRSP
jgi:hypothetical protein